MKRRKTLPKEMEELLKRGDIAALKEQFLHCEPNAVNGKYGSNIFSLTPLPREFAFWAKEQGADVNYKDYYGKTPIFNHASFWNGDVRLLIDLGAEIHVAQDDGTTPFHLAALYGRVEAVKALLEAGADVNIKSGRLDWPGYLTPLEKTLLQDRLPYPLLLEICQILLDHGATITSRCREYLSKSAERFQRVKQGITDLDFLHSQTEGLDRLCLIFGVEPAAESVFHDGKSSIHVPEEYKNRAFQWLWNYLVPPRGRAQTAQGEAIRIAGRVDHEITANGSINWDSDFRKMLRAFPQYLRLGNPLSEEDILQAERITRFLKNSWDDGTLTIQLCAYAVTWVLLNPEVLPPLEADYSR
ncbi:MAG: ankyrin repeat domain-containing protein [Oscillospiraceae bacterium]|nr:ankyrin repeat domain-containing protein [Oscillospiraceae bacterium]